MPKADSTHFMILLNTRLKMPNFVDMSINTDPIKLITKGTGVDIVRTTEKAYISGSHQPGALYYSHLEGLLKQVVESHPEGFRLRIGWAQEFTFLMNSLTNVACYHCLFIQRGLFCCFLFFWILLIHR